MKKKGTLNYYKEYTILNPDGAKKASYSELRLIGQPDGCYMELYAVLLKKGKTHGRWAVIDNHGNRITPVKYRRIDNGITKAGDQFVIIVQCEDERENAIALDGREIFVENYYAIDPSYYHWGREICILRDDDERHGLGNLATGEVILSPRYSYIHEIEGSNLFLFRDEPHYRTEEWGLLDENGEVLFEPQFTGYMYERRWGDYNVLMTSDTIRGNSHYHYLILDRDGYTVYRIWSRKPYQPFSIDTLPWGNEKAENAFIFFEDEGNLLRGDVAKLVVCENDWDNNKNIVHECTFRYRERHHGRDDINRLAHRAAQKNGLEYAIYRGHRRR